LRSPTRPPTCGHSTAASSADRRLLTDRTVDGSRRLLTGVGAFRPSRAHPFNPLNGFTHYWTLSSKFFSTFPRGTCSLSVSWRYLALEGVYLPLRAARSSNPTLRKGPGARSRHASLRAWHPLWVDSPVHEDLDVNYRTDARGPPEHHISRRRLNPTRDSVLDSSLFARRYWGNPS